MTSPSSKVMSDKSYLGEHTIRYVYVCDVTCPFTHRTDGHVNAAGGNVATSQSNQAGKSLGESKMFVVSAY